MRSRSLGHDSLPAPNGSPASCRAGGAVRGGNRQPWPDARRRGARHQRRFFVSREPGRKRVCASPLVKAFAGALFGLSAATSAFAQLPAQSLLENTLTVQVGSFLLGTDLEARL